MKDIILGILVVLLIIAVCIAFTYIGFKLYFFIIMEVFHLTKKVGWIIYAIWVVLVIIIFSIFLFLNK